MGALTGCIEIVKKGGLFVGIVKTGKEAQKNSFSIIEMEKEFGISSIGCSRSFDAVPFAECRRYGSNLRPPYCRDGRWR